MKKIKICTPVVGKTLKEFLRNLDQVQEISDMVELRVDDITDLGKSDLILIKKKIKKEAILTSSKKEIILEALDLEFDFVDIELSLLSSLNLSKSGKNKIIISFHDFKKTPDVNKLKTTLKNMRKFTPEIMKIATMVNNRQDVSNLFKILLNKKTKEKIIIVGMGRKGKITRIFGPLFGSFLTFAKTKYGLSEKGQIDIKEMENIYKLLVTNH